MSKSFMKTDSCQSENLRFLKVQSIKQQQEMSPQDPWVIQWHLQMFPTTKKKKKSLSNINI